MREPLRPGCYPRRYPIGPAALRSAVPDKEKTPPERGFRLERMMGLEPTTFCMASRRSSQLSYIRESGRL
jgi:hypothetical protein